jgi:molecular chaperone DnaK
MEGNEAVVIPNAEGRRTTPSIIAFVEGERLKEILQKTSGNKSKTIASIKRFMGHSLLKFKRSKRVSYKVVKGTTIHHVWILMVVYTLHKNCQQ